jgi:DNA repair exonuclease SbcCD nuclease subunit
MKIAIISDTHFGARNDSPIFLNYSLEYFENIFFPYLEENNIKEVIHLGDLFDRRKYINFNTLASVRRKFIDKFQELNIKLHIILGNHDVYYKNTNHINSIKELFDKGYENIKIYESPTEVVFDGICVGLVPWINPENFEESIDFIQNNSCSILCGHFEINGFEVMAGIRHEGGVERFIFGNYDKVLSGHFHLKQTHGNIHYLGTQYQLSFADVGSKKGFHVLNGQDRSLEFIENKNSLFYTLRYDDASDGFEKTINKVKFDKYANCFIKVVVLNKKKQKVFDDFIEKITSVGVQQLQIIEDTSISSKLDDADVDVSEDTITIISKEIDGMDDISDKNKLKLIIKDLYMESLSI